MDATAISAAQHGASPTARLVCAGLAAWSLAACKPKAPEGISVICDSHGKNEYSVPKRGECHSLPGGDAEDCYELVPVPPVFKCYGKDEWLNMDTGDSGGETGEAEETKGIYREGWPTHEPSLTYIIDHCTHTCVNMNPNQDFTCKDDNWTIYGYDGINRVFSKVLATALEEPGALNCDPDLGKWKRRPEKSNVVENESAFWPSDGAAIELACATILNCAERFDENVLHHLVSSSPTPPGNDEAEADYLATTNISTSNLWLRIANPDNSSEASNTVEGRIEYTALDCGQPTCPLYLGNITVANTDDAWELHSEALNADVEVTHLQARLLGPTLGVWRPATGEVYFDDQMLDLRVDFDLAVAGDETAAVIKYVTNDGGVFGILHGDHAVELTNLSVRDEDLKASASLVYDSVDGSPPVASFTLPPTVVLGHLEPGLLVSSIPEHSTDPDDDLDWKLWLIDGQQVAPGYVIPPGVHSIRLEVRDTRNAFDEQEQLVTITYED